MNTKSSVASAKLLAAILANARQPKTLRAFLVQARDDVAHVEEYNKKHEAPETQKGADAAIRLVRDLLDMIEARYDLDYELCSVRAARLDSLIMEIGSVIEFTLGNAAK